MKIYMLVNCGVDHNSVLGVYVDKELAEKDMEFVVHWETERDREIREDDGTGQVRWVKIGDVWFNQHRWKLKEDEWPSEWPDFNPEENYSCDSIRIIQYETRELSLQDRVDAVNVWQNNQYAHPLTCGNDSTHPLLKPEYDVLDHEIILRCRHMIDEHQECGWIQDESHPIFEIINASYLSNRPQT